MINRLFTRKENRINKLGKLSIGDKIPLFALPAADGRTIGSTELGRQPLVVVFYPADSSPVCSSQLALYNEALDMITDQNARLVAISVDDVKSHKSFAESMKLRFPLLSDENPRGDVSNAFGVYNEKDGVSERALFVFDSKGILRWEHLSPRNVNPGAHGILNALENVE